MQDLLSGLNEAQREAVTHGEGPLLVAAGPGSGKTRVVTHRLAWLLRQGVGPEGLLAVTFTNRAAAEMRERVRRLVPSEGLWVSTFHSACARVLRENAEAAGLPRAFSIYDEEDRRRLLRRVLREMDLAADLFTPGALGARVSRWKNEGVLPAGAREAAWGPREEGMARAYARYEEALAGAGALDFDDLLLRAWRLLEQRPDVLARYAARLRHVLVDEYQDTNRVQFLLARALASGTRNLCAVGDPDQSIYGWRGADLRNILEFQAQFPDAKVVRLERNYRSSRRILAAADSLIRHNRARLDKTLLTDAADGEPVRVLSFPGVDREGEAVADEVRAWIDAGGSAADAAVLYRVHARSRAVERGLRARRIPYRVVRGVEFFGRAEVKDLVAWLRLLANPRDEEAAVRVLTAPGRGAGDGSVARVLEAARGRSIPARDAILLEGEACGVRGRAGKAVDAVAERLRDLLGRPAAPVLPLLREVVDSTGYLEWLREHWPDDHPERAENVEELLVAAASYDERDGGRRGLEGFLEEAALVSDQDRYDPSQPRVSLMTLHTAKGLEFPAVFIVGVEQGLVPYERPFARDDDGEAPPGGPGGVPWDPAEEERRLLFVGMTRAMRLLWLSCSLRAPRWASGPEETRRESPFLDEIGSAGVRRESHAFPEPAGGPFGAGGRGGPRGGRGRGGGPFVDPPQDPAAPFDPAAPLDPIAEGPPVLPRGDVPGRDAGRLREGILVRHDRFGTGRLRRLVRAGSHLKATVEFRAGTKTLDLAFARLEPLEEAE